MLKCIADTTLIGPRRHPPLQYMWG